MREEDVVAHRDAPPVPTIAEARAASPEDWYALEPPAPETGYRDDGAQAEEVLVVPQPPPSRLVAGSWAGAGLVLVLVGSMCLALVFALGEIGTGVVLGPVAVLTTSLGLWMMRVGRASPTPVRAQLRVGRGRIAVSWDQGPVTTLAPIESVHVGPALEAGRVPAVVMTAGRSGEHDGALVHVRSVRGAELLVVRLAERLGLVPERMPDGGLLARPPAGAAALGGADAAP